MAPSKNPFFVRFIAEFQKCAWEQDTLLLYVEVPEYTSLEDCLYRLYCKDIRNAVVWPDDQRVDEEKLLRLRSIGMNLVFFDTDAAHPFADSVFLDNKDAVETLLRAGDALSLIHIFQIFEYCRKGRTFQTVKESEQKETKNTSESESSFVIPFMN